MLVREEEPTRAYVQLIESYKSDPELLSRDLPHRSPEQLDAICRNLTILRWSDLYQVPESDCDASTRAAAQEIERRITAGVRNGGYC